MNYNHNQLHGIKFLFYTLVGSKHQLTIPLMFMYLWPRWRCQYVNIFSALKPLAVHVIVPSGTKCTVHEWKQWAPCGDAYYFFSSSRMQIITFLFSEIFSSLYGLRSFIILNIFYLCPNTYLHMCDHWQNYVLWLRSSCLYELRFKPSDHEQTDRRLHAHQHQHQTYECIAPWRQETNIWTWFQLFQNVALII